MTATIQHHTTDRLTGEDVFAETGILSKSLVVEMLQRMIESAEDYHSWSLSDQDGSRIIKLIRHKQRIICSSFAFQMNRHFSEFKTDNDNSQSNRGLDDWQKLGLSGASEKAETDVLKSIALRYADAFHEFDRSILKRLQTCIKRSRASIYDNPLQVKKLLESFQYALSSLGLETSCKIALYHLFADRFIDTLGPLYRRIDRQLLESGMLPEMPVARIQLRSLEGLSASSPPGNLKPGRSATRLLLLQQFKEKAGRGEDPAGKLLLELKAHLDAAGLTEHDQQIDQLDSIFKLILADEDLPKAIKHQLKRLQVFILMTAMQEEASLSSSSHPARKLLDAIVKREVEIDRAGDPSFSGIDFLRQEIDAIEQSGSVTSDHYQQLLDNYVDFLTRHETKIRKSRKRDATLKVLPKVRSRLAELTQPLKVQGSTLIMFDKVWLPLLVQIALKQGMDSELWEKSISVVRKQVWALIPKSNPEEQQELIQSLPKISHSLHRAMRGLRLTDELQQSMSDFLKLEHQNVLDQTARNIMEAKMRTRSLSAQSFGNNPESNDFDAMMETGIFQLPAGLMDSLNPKESAASRSVEQVEALSVGDWLNTTHKGSKTLTKLAWKADDSSLFIFVDRNGKRVCEVGAEQLAKQFERGEASMPGSSSGADSEKTQFSFMKQI